jgi:hypothetical protein
MFEKAKKDSFLNEVKSVMRTSGQKFITESGTTRMFYGGNEVTSCPSNAVDLKMSGSKEVSYIIDYNSAGDIIRFRIGNGSYYIEVSGSSASGGVKIDQITDGDIQTVEPDNFFDCNSSLPVSSNLFDVILENNTPNSDSSIDFSSVSSSSNGRGLYYTSNNTYGEDNTRIYYYRGNVNNNWVSFAGKLWRIVRTTSEGGIKLVYSGTGSGNGSAFIDESDFSINNDTKYRIGYTYNTDLNGYSGPQTNSAIKDVIDDWYDDNLNSFSNYLSNTAIFCNDRSEEREAGSYGSYINYPAYDRLACLISDSSCYGNEPRPTYACSATNKSRYTVSSSNGNGYLSRPIALLTADEVAYAGLVDSSNGGNDDDFDSYIMVNASNSGWWLMTPDTSHYDGSVAGMFSVKPWGSLGGFLEATYVRPSISLKACVSTNSGTGTKSKPFVLSDSDC